MESIWKTFLLLMISYGRIIIMIIVIIIKEEDHDDDDAHIKIYCTILHTLPTLFHTGTLLGYIISRPHSHVVKNTATLHTPFLISPPASYTMMTMMMRRSSSSAIPVSAFPHSQPISVVIMSILHDQILSSHSHKNMTRYKNL